MTYKNRLLLLITFIAIPLLLYFNVASAAPDEQPFYNLKRLYEKIQLNFKNSPDSQVDYLISLLDTRLIELTDITHNQPKYLYSTSLRYSTTAGQIAELVVNNKLENRKEEVKKKLESHLTAVNDLERTYPRNDEEIKFVVDAENYLNSYIGQLTNL